MLTEFTIIDIMKSLRLKKDLTKPMVLVLGSRAGGLFRSQQLYTLLEPYAGLTFSTLSRLQQFAECYRILTRGQAFGLSLSDIHGIVTNALYPINTSNADKYLAHFVQEGMFDTIVTTNVDTLIEDALADRGWKNTYNFEVLSLTSTHQYRLDYSQHIACRIIHTFGQVSGKYQIQGRLGFLQHHLQWKNLSDLLSRSIVIGGLDPIWDRELYQIFPYTGDSLWFINEERLNEDHGFYPVADARNGQTFTGEHANYEHFMEHLHTAFFLTASAGRMDISPGIQTSPNQKEHITTQSMPDQNKKRNNERKPGENAPSKKTLKIFIASVSQDDEALHTLLAHLSSLKREKRIDIWHRNEMLAGQAREAESDRHLRNARIILLLVSQNFLNSDDMYTGELKRAMEQHASEQSWVIPIIVRPCDWQHTSFAHLKVLPGNGEPVTSQHWRNQGDAFLDIVRGIRNVANTLL